MFFNILSTRIFPERGSNFVWCIQCDTPHPKLFDLGWWSTLDVQDTPEGSIIQRWTRPWTSEKRNILKYLNQCMKCWRFFADMTMLSSIRLAGILHKVLPKTYYSLAGNTFWGQPGGFLVLAHSNTFTEYWVIFLLFQFQPTTPYSQMCFQWTHYDKRQQLQGIAHWGHTIFFHQWNPQFRYS